MMKFGSLFSGIGGFDLGFERAGMVAAWQCEIDKQAQEVLHKHWGVEVYNDVKTIGRNAGTVDLICGGFPCQDLSVAGKRAGLAGNRSGLWFEFARIIDELEPRWVVIENVPGLLSSNNGLDFAIIIHWLVKRGYGVCWRILDAQYFGVPQRRRRVFIVASFGNGRAAEVLFESESMSGDIATGRETGKDIAAAIVSRIGKGGFTDPVSDNIIAFDGRNMDTHDQSPTLQAKKEGYSLNYTPMVFQQNARDEVRLMGGDGRYAGALAAQAGMKQQNYIAYNIMPQNSGRDYKAKETNISQNLTTNGNHSGDQGGTYVAIQHAMIGRDKGGPDGKGWRDDGKTWTLDSRGDADAIAHPNTGVRRLTPTECARLQGFPDDWNSWLSDTVRYRQFGNAVAVPVAEWIGKRIMEVENA